MTLRQRHTELTRTAILDAAAETLFASSDPGSMTMQDVADAAGVSHRTLYRHFPSRRELALAVGRHVEERLLRRAGREVEFPPTFADYLATAEQSIVFAATNPDEMRKMLIASLAMGVWRTDRDEHYWRVFREAFPHLEEDEARVELAVLRHLLGASSWFLIGERFGIDLQTLSAAVTRAARLLAEGVAERDREAARGGPPPLRSAVVQRPDTT